jgi:hypothetical protein
MLKRLLIFPAMLITYFAGAQEASPNGGVQTEIQSAGNVNNPGIGSIFSPNLYDGTATVNIPIYDYSVNSLNLGVSIGYDTHGIRVNQLPSSVGIGWGLSLGKITRQVQGIEDEVCIYGKKSTQYPYPVPLYMGAWFEDRNAGSGTHIQYETEYDQFTASFAGRSITFTIGIKRDGTYVVKTDPIKNIKIHPFVQNSDASSPVGGNSGFASSLFFELGKSPTKNKLAFNITDEVGNVFTFSSKSYQEKRPNDTCVYYAPASWDLTDIHTSNGQHIRYTYGQRDVDFIIAHTQQTLDVLEDIYWASAGGTFISRNVYNRDEQYIKRQGKESYIQKIEYPNGVAIDFEYKNDQLAGYHTYPLAKIIVSSSSKLGYVNKRAFEFNYTFLISKWYNNVASTEYPYLPGVTMSALFSGQGLNTGFTERLYDAGTRLKLNSINLVGNDGQTKEKYYAFSYNPIPLPMRFDEGQDYYGYYNGKVKNQSIPAFFRPFNGISHTHLPSNLTYGMDKTPDFNFTKAGILERIENGMGASIELKFKEHVLSNPAQGYIGCTYTGSVPPATVFPTYEQEAANDGICISEVIVRDGYTQDNTTKTTFEFNDGQRFFRGGFSWVPYGSNYDCDLTLEARIYNNSCITPMQFINGSNHGYSYAEVKNYNSNQEMIAKTKYHYTNLMWHDNPLRSNLKMNNNTRYNHYPVDYFYSHRMGKLLDITSYDENDVVIKKEEFSYHDYFVSHIQSQLAFKSHTNKAKAGLCEVEYWNFNAFPFLTKKHKTYTYTNNGMLGKEVEYVYNALYDLRYITWLDDDGRTNYKELTYAYSAHLPPAIQVYSIPVATDLKRVIDGTTYLIDRNETKWELPSGGDGRYQLASQSKLFNNEPTSGNPATMISKSQEYTKRDDRNNVLETRLDDREDYVTDFWDTRIGKKTAVVEGARFEQVAYTSFEGEFESVSTADFNRGNWNFDPTKVVKVSTSAVDQPMTGRHYYHLTGSDGVYTAFVPVNGKRYVVSIWATDKPHLTQGGNTHQFTEMNKIGNWYFYTAEFTGNGGTLTITRDNGAPNSVLLDELRLHPVGAAMSTTCYEPLFGPSSTCDERNNITYYEYDVMGRMIVSRDINRNVLSSTKHIIAGNDTY